ncbi:MAG: sarcosine oxidase subunit gamma family protein [Solirubrobacteraceae bacterium]
MILDVLHTDPGIPARSLVADALELLGASIVDGRCRHCGDPAAERAASAATVVLADRSDLGVLDVRVGDGCGPRGPAVAQTLPRGGWACRLTDDRELLIVPRDRIAAERDARLGEGEDVVDLSAGHVVLVVAGPLAREALARASALDLRSDRAPIGAYRPGSVAHVGAVVLREAEERYLVIAGAAHALHLWEVLVDAVIDLGGRPAGLEALAGSTTDRQETARA